MQLRFWHSYDLQSNRDGGRLEASVDNGSNWFTVESTGSGVAFAQNGYNSTMDNKGANPNTFGDFAGLRAWSGNSSGFIETILSITNSSKFAGRTVRFRWVLATDSSTASTGWYVDSIQLTGMAPAEQQSGEPPLITAEPRTDSEEVEEDGDVIYEVIRDTETILTVSADDDGGESNLRYTWSATGGSVSFSPNGDNAAKSATATFSSAGDYTLTVTVADGDGLTTSSSVAVRVKQTGTGTDISPPSVSVVYGGTQLFTAQQLDQFGDEMAVQPVFDWSVSGGGTIGSNGLFTAGTVGGPYTVTGAAGSLSGVGQVSVTPATATVTLGNLSATYDGSAKTVSVTTAPVGLATSVTYNGSASAPVNAGSYAVAATVTDPNYTGSASGTLVIAQASQTITFGALPAKTFGDASFAAGGTASSGLTVSYASSNTNVATVSGGTISIVGAGTSTITATQGGNTNYEAAAPVAQTLTVAAATASVTLGNLSQTYDGGAKTVTVTTDPPDLVVNVTYDSSTTAPTQAGSYSVAAAVTDPNYAGSASGTLVVARASQSITFGALPAKTFGEAPFAAGASASSGLAISYASSNTNVATVEGGNITIVGAGSTGITASQAGDTNHEAAVPAEQILTVFQATATVALGGLNQAFDGEPKPVTVTTEPEGLTVNVTYDGESAPPSEAGSYAVVATVDEANYTGSASGTLVIEEVLPTFERWISQFEGLTDVTPAGDPDMDGLSNAEEYFMGLDPTLNDAAGATVQGVGIDGIHLDYRRSKEIHGITGTVRWSTAPGVAAVWSHESVSDVLLQDHGTWELRRASVPWLQGAAQIFLRLDLTME